MSRGRALLDPTREGEEGKEEGGREGEGRGRDGRRKGGRKRGRGTEGGRGRGRERGRERGGSEREINALLLGGRKGGRDREVNALQWNLRRKDTLGTALLSFLRRLFLSRRFMKYFHFITFYITWGGI